MTRNTWLVTIAILASLAGLLHLCGNRSHEESNVEVLPVGVTVSVVERRDLPVTVTAAGRAEAKASVSVKSRLDGQVAEVAYDEGQSVHKGQLLLRFDTAVLETQERQAEGVLARDEAQLVKAKCDYQRNVALVAKAFLAKSSLSQAEADLGTAEASIKVDRANLDNAHLQLGFARITAPIDGVAGVLLLPVGGAAKANDTTFLVINQATPIDVTFSVPDAQLAQLKLAKDKGDVPVSATVAGIDHPMQGKLAFIDNAVDTTSGTIIAKAVDVHPELTHFRG